MSTVSTFSSTGNPYVDGVLTGLKWGGNSLTYSFPTSPSTYGAGYGSGEQLNHFSAFTSVQRDAIRSVLAQDAAVAKLAFSEVTETAGVHGDLRYAKSDWTGTAWAYYPSTSALGGDAWFNNSTHWYDSPAKGNYAFLTMLHETGHALGLKHPHEAMGAFAAMPADHDSLEYSLMSYRSYVGASTTGGYTNGAGSYPQTLMMYDIAGLQQLYGANYATNRGDTVYQRDPASGREFVNGSALTAPTANKIFMTLWDGGGNDTYDFSHYTTNLSVNLNPGAWTTVAAAELANLGNSHYAAGNIANALLHNGNPASLIENVVGGSGADTMVGNSADNRFTGGHGNDVISGGAGTDTAVFSGSLSDYARTHNADGSWTIADRRDMPLDGTDTLAKIEFLKFADALVGLNQTAAIAPVHTAPVAHNNHYAVATNHSLAVGAARGVLVNDADADGDALSAILVSRPGHGSLTFRHNGSFIFNPAHNFAGTVSFLYMAFDGLEHSHLAKVSISIGHAAKAAAGKGQGPGDTSDIFEDQAPAPAHHGVDLSTIFDHQHHYDHGFVDFMLY